MDKKKIQLAVVVVAFLGMGVILYKTFFPSSGPSSASVIAGGDINVASLTPASLLPYGTAFDYQKIDDLQKQGFQYGVVQYPVVSSSTDVGKSVDSIIAPLPAATGP